MEEVSNREVVSNASKGDLLDLEQIPIILRIPKECYSLTITATILGKDGKPNKVTKELSVSDIFKCRKDFIDYVGDDEYDAVYTITDAGREWLESLRKEKEENA